MYITSNSDVCLEDLDAAYRNNDGYMLAEYHFNGAPTGNSRKYYSSTVNSQTFKFYYGTAPDDARKIDNEPARSEANGLYFDTDDFISQQIKDTTLTFEDYFTVELWCRFVESKPSQNYYLF